MGEKSNMENEYDAETGNLILVRYPREKIVGYEKGIDGKADYNKGIKAIILLVEIREKVIDEKKEYTKQEFF